MDIRMRRYEELVPAGVHSMERSYGLEFQNFMVSSAEGCKITLSDGTSLIDYVMNWGSALLGYSHPVILEAINNVLRKLGTCSSFPSELELKLFRELLECYPYHQMIRMVNSRTEGIILAIKLARSATNRNRVLLFEGAMHGFADHLLARTTSLEPLLSVPLDSGVHRRMVKDTIVIRFNDREALEDVMDKEGENIAAVIIDPYLTDMGLILPKVEFIEALKKYTSTYNILVISDEYRSAFREGLTGVSATLGLKPDLTLVGGIVSGFPVGFLMGSEDIMYQLAPLGTVYQSEPLVGSQIAIGAFMAVLKLIKETEILGEVSKRARSLQDGLLNIANSLGVPIQVNRYGNMLGVYFCDRELRDAVDAQRASFSQYVKLRDGLIAEGVLVTPSSLQAWTVSYAHTDEDIQRTLEAFDSVLRRF